MPILTTSLLWFGGVALTLAVEEALKAKVGPWLARDVQTALVAATNSWAAELPDHLALPPEAFYTLTPDRHGPAIGVVATRLADGEVPSDRQWLEAYVALHAHIRGTMPLEDLAPFFAAELDEVERHLEALAAAVHREVSRIDPLFKSSTTASLERIEQRLGTLPGAPASPVPSGVGVAVGVGDTVIGNAESPVIQATGARIRDAVSLITEREYAASLKLLAKIEQGLEPEAARSATIRAKLHNNRGVALLNLERVHEAFASFSRACAAEATPRIQLNLAVSAALLGRHDETVRYASQVLDDPELRGKAAATLVGAHDRRGDLDALQAILDLEWLVFDPVAMLEVARFHARYGRRDGAFAALKLPLDDTETGPEAHMVAAELHLGFAEFAAREGSPPKSGRRLLHSTVGTLAKEDLDEARKHLEHALAKLTPAMEGQRVGVLVNLGLVNMLSGDLEVAQRYWEEALDLGDDDAAVINLAALLAGQGLAEVALQTLERNPKARTSRPGILLASELLLATGRPSEAVKAIEGEGALEAWDDMVDRAATVLVAAAIDGATSMLTAQAIAHLHDRSQTDVVATLTLARYHAETGDMDAATELLGRFIATHGPSARVVGLRGQMLAEVQRFSAAIECLEAAPLDELDPHAGTALAVSYLRENRLGDVVRTVEELRRSGQAEPQAFDAAARAHSIAGDLESALGLMEEMCASSDQAARAQVEILGLHLRSGNEAAARALSVQVSAEDLQTLSAYERIQAARLLHVFGDPRSLDIAYRAWVAGQQDPDTLRTFLVFCWELGEDDWDQLKRDSIGPGCCFVAVSGEERRVLSVLAVDDQPVDPMAEFFPSEGAVSPFLGKEVGDEVVLRPGLLDETTWTVEKIIPRLARAAEITKDTLTTRFPDVDGLWKLRMDPANPLAVARTLATMAAPRQEALKVYTKGALPVATLADLAGRSIPQTFRALFQDPEQRVHCWQGSGQAQEADAATARRTLENEMSVVVDYTSLCLLAVMSEDLREPILRSGLKLHVPQAVIDDLTERATSDARLNHGRRGFLWLEGGKVNAAEMELDDLIHSDLLDFVRNVAKPIACTALLAKPGRPLQSVAELGSPSSHALWEAEYRGWPLLVDDTVLWRFGADLAGAMPFGTRALLQALAEKGQISSTIYEQALAWFAKAGMSFLPVNSTILTRALARALWIWNDELDALMSTLEGPECDALPAIQIAAEMLRDLGLNAGAGPGDARVVAGILGHLIVGREPLAVVRRVRRLTELRLHLAPIGRDRVLALIDVWSVSANIPPQRS